MIQSSPALRELMGDKKTRDSDDTISFKKFPGGFLAMAGAGSPSNLAMRAIRVTLLDEIDKYETTKEGDPVALAEERTATFKTSALSVRACSPTWEETSRIFRSWLESDQRRAYCACPHCGHEQTLDFFGHVHWEKTEIDHKPWTAAVYCEGCGTAWSETDLLRINTTRGSIRWYQTRPFICDCEHSNGEVQDPRVERLWEWVEDEHQQVGRALCKHCGKRAVSNHHAGFTASKLYSPFSSAADLATKWLAAKDDPDTKQTFYNTQLGQPFRAEVSKEVSAHFLASRREKYQGEVPEGVGVLTIGVDVQAGGQANQGRLEAEVIGWGVGEENWSIATPIFLGDPAQPYVWDELDEFLLRGFMHVRGFPLYIQGGCIDSGGHNTNEVYAFARQRIGRNIWAIKGASDKSGQWSPIWPPLEREKQHKRFRTGFRPILIGVNSGKESIRQKLLVERPDDWDGGPIPGYSHFRHDQSDAWFDQLTAENLVVERKAGSMTRRWAKKKNVANEALDARVYAYAALKGLQHTRKLDLAQAVAQVAAYNPKPVEPARVAAPAGRRIIRSPFMAD